MVTLSNYLILCHPLLLLPSISPSIRIFSNELALCIMWPKDWSFCFSISLSNEYLGLISFGIDWFDLLAVQGTLKSLQHHSSIASILWCSAFFVIQLSHLWASWWLRWTGVHLQSNRLRSDLRFWKIPWRRQPTPVFRHGKSHGDRSQVGYSPWGHK